MDRVVYEPIRRVADLQPNLSVETNGRTVDQSDINLFCGLTGDMNPLHLSEVDALEGPAKSIVAPATIVQAMAIGLFAQTRWIQPILVVFVGMTEWRAEKPVFPGDTIRARVTVAGVRPTSDGRSHIAETLFEVFAHRGAAHANGGEDPRVMHFTMRFMVRDHELRSVP